MGEKEKNEGFVLEGGRGTSFRFLAIKNKCFTS